ncbi:MAG: TonB-dependent siderophore receptor [Haliea sp.]|nr:TonB-dependent siderophore receptor [Haliea sp.]
MAAEGSQAPALEELVVYGTGYRTTGTKSDLLPLEAPMSYEIYDGELLARRQVDTVNEALRYVPGITPENRGTVTIFDQYTIRGFDSYYNYYDGLPLQYNSLWNLVPQVDAFATETIEVLKGPTSVLYGAAPPGGMVNQTAKQPLGEQQTLLRLRGGSSDLREIGLDTTGPASDSVNYRVIALWRESDGQQVTTEEERRTLAPSLTWDISSRTRLNLNLYYQDDPALVPSTPLPALGTLYRADYGRLDADAFAGDRAWSGMEREVTMLGYKLNHEFNEQWSFLQNFRFTDAEAFQKNTYNFGLQADGRTLTRSAYFTDEAQEGFVVDNQLAWSTELAGASHRLLFGVEYRELDSDIRYGDTLGFDTPAIDLAAPNHSLFDAASLPLDSYTEAHRIEQEQLGVYLQDEIRWQALTVVAGLRWDDYQSSDVAENNYLGSAYGSTTDIDQDQVSGRLAAMLNLDGGWAPYANYSESFEPTSGQDSLTGQPFEPTTAEQLEAGLKYRAPARDLTLTAAWFDLRKQNVVVNTPDFMQYTQNGEVKSEGVELALSTRLGEQWTLDATATWLDVEVTDNPLNPALEGKTPVWVADQQASLWLGWEPLPSIAVNAGVRYVGESQLDAANSDTLPSYTLYDLVFSWAIDDTWELGLSATNLTDETYVGACYDASNCWMGVERRVEAVLNARF